MGYRFHFQPEQRLIVIVFEGRLSPEEEMQAVLDTVNDPNMMQDARILVDRRKAQLTVGPEHVDPHIELVKRHLDKFGNPRVATVVAKDYDFGMLRMLEMKSESLLQHDFMVFRDLEEAYTWLGLAAQDIVWP